MSVQTLYDRDFALWAERTASALREGRFGEVDAENAAEEIEALSRSDSRELHSRLAVLIAHLLKWKHRRDVASPSWRATIDLQRADIAQLLADSPSLRARIDMGKTYRKARAYAVLEAGPLEFPFSCPFTLEEILDEEYLPL
jgi:hypothetical protein